MIIYLISGPRNVSTALMYSFNQRPDMVVVDEPFHGMWLKRLGKRQPYFDEIMLGMECDDADKIHDEIEEKEKLQENIFVKNMANTVKYMNTKRLLKYRHVFLIRDPADTIISHAKVDSLITSEDLCLEHQVKLYNWMKQTMKEDPIVIDGNELRKDPLTVLTRACNRLNIPFTDEMLSWPVGEKSVDGVWAPAWYSEVHTSTGFRAPSTTKITRNDIPTALVKVYDEVLPYYQELHSYSI